MSTPTCASAIGQRSKSCGRIEVSVRSGPAKRPSASALNFCQPGWATFLKEQIFGPGEPQIENGLQPLIEGSNGHRTSHKSISDSVRQYDFAADRAPARCALLRFKVRSSRHSPGLFADVTSKADKRISPTAPRPSAVLSPRLLGWVQRNIAPVLAPTMPNLCCGPPTPSGFTSAMIGAI